MVRAGFEGMLAASTDLEVVGEAENGEEAVRLVERLAPDVVLMDLRMPEMDGVEAADRGDIGPARHESTRPHDLRLRRGHPARHGGRARPATCSRTRRGQELFRASQAAARGEPPGPRRGGAA